MSSEPISSPLQRSERRALKGFLRNTAPDLNSQPQGFLDWYRELHEVFAPWQQRLVDARGRALAAALEGDAPNHLTPSAATEESWRISLSGMVPGPAQPDDGTR